MTSLRSRVEQEIVNSAEPVAESDVKSALSACAKLENVYEQSSDASSPLPETPSDEVRGVLKQILESKNVKLSQDILKSFFASHPPPSADSALMAMKIFQRRTDSSIPRDVTMIPFRRAVYSADFPSSFALMDAAVNSSQYRAMVRKQWQKYAAYWAVGTGTILSGVELLLQSGLVGVWESTGMVHMMVLTYLSSVSLYAGLAFGGRLSGNGEILKWTQGTVTTHWFSHAAEMRMASLIADVNRSLPENQDECSFKLRQDLKKRNMATVEVEQESLLKEYWAKGGEGFEWIEPDQDPAEILWRHKMDATRAKRLGSPYSKQPDANNEWADQVIQQSLPHASLIDTGDKTLPERPENPAIGPGEK
ncbi:hypothetical protein TRVA0_018S00496 [Trichomonascus vanleenenianus]|uniref:uncharacterized protein n=1 Tax=Trichomonascus vanleenenianus TaxID=2268995 RepID=UPI003EC9C7D0